LIRHFLIQILETAVFLERNDVLLKEIGQKRYITGRKTNLIGQKGYKAGRKTTLIVRKRYLVGHKPQ